MVNRDKSPNRIKELRLLKDLKAKDYIIQELQKKYTDTRNANKELVNTAEEHGLHKELTDIQNKYLVMREE